MMNPNKQRKVARLIAIVLVGAMVLSSFSMLLFLPGA